MYTRIPQRDVSSRAQIFQMVGEWNSKIKCSAVKVSDDNGDTSEKHGAGCTKKRGKIIYYIETDNRPGFLRHGDEATG